MDPEPAESASHATSALSHTTAAMEELPNEALLERI
jgi:hypothetical protein